MILSLLLLGVSSVWADHLPEHFFKKGQVQSKFIRKVDQCTPTKSEKMVYFVKQWHLAPSVDSTDVKKSKNLPQAKNQTEIYSAIAQLIGEKTIDTAVAEGCEGEIDSKFKETFNGWNFEKLAKEPSGKNYSSILTNVLLKAEVKYPEQLKTLCGDNLAQIKNAQLALSDLRGDFGYWKRIVENEKNPAKLKLYLDGVIEALKLPATTDAQNALIALKKDLLESFQKFNAANAERNAALVKTVKEAKSGKPILVVYGGLHTDDLKAKFQAEKWNCEIYEPKTYKNDEEKILDEFKKLTR